MLGIRGAQAVVRTGDYRLQRRGPPHSHDAGAREDRRPRDRRTLVMDARMLEILACPVCKGTLKYQRDAEVLVCRLDRLAYPIRDDVPVMLEEEARQLAADDPLLDR